MSFFSDIISKFINPKAILMQTEEYEINLTHDWKTLTTKFGTKFKFCVVRIEPHTDYDIRYYNYFSWKYPSNIDCKTFQWYECLPWCKIQARLDPITTIEGTKAKLVYTITTF